MSSKTKYGVPLTGPLTYRQRAEVRRRLGPVFAARSASATKAARTRRINRTVERIIAACFPFAADRSMPLTREAIRKILEDVL